MRFSTAALAVASSAVLAIASLHAQSPLPPAVQAAEKSIDAEKIRAHVRFLADDLLEGRGPGVRGGNLAAEYIATQFALDGLKPAGDNGTFFQQVDFFGMTVKLDQTKFSLVPNSGAPIPLKFGPDYVVNNPRHTPVMDIDAPIVFVGYGVTAPEFNWDDYAGIDVKGKVVLMIVGDPPSDDPKFFAGKALTYYGRWVYKYEQAARKGAIGALLIHRTDLASYPWSVVQNSGSGEKTFLAANTNPAVGAAAWIHHDVSDKLFASAGLPNTDAEIASAGKRGFKAVELPVKLQAHIESTVRPYKSPNVVGIVPGTDTGQPQTSSHVLRPLRSPRHRPLPPRRQDLQRRRRQRHRLRHPHRARARLGLHPTPPPHTVIFASVTAEEQGLLGSEYLGQHPPVPAEISPSTSTTTT